MHILVADTLPDSVREGLEADGHTVDERPELTGPDLPGALDGVDVLVVRSTEVTSDAIEAADSLQLIVRAGAGVNTIDAGAAADRGIHVSNVPGRNAIAVAELTLALILALDRNVADNVADLRAGRWDKSRYSEARGLLGRTLGIVGCGDIGLAVAERAVGFGLHVLAEDKPRDDERAARIDELGIELVDGLTELARRSDILTFHVPASPDTEDLVGPELLEAVRPGTWIINTSRGSVVDEDALLAALDEKDLRAGLDVYRGEPESKQGAFDHPLAAHPRVYGTHHIGASTEQAQQAVADGVVEVVTAFAAGRILNCVNLASRRLGSATLSVRHLDRVGVLSGVLRVLKEAGINVQQMENRIFAGGNAAMATISVSGDVTDDLVERMQAVEHVLHVGVSPVRS